jgi:hypothetical protein
MVRPDIERRLPTVRSLDGLLVVLSDVNHIKEE